MKWETRNFLVVALSLAISFLTPPNCPEVLIELFGFLCVGKLNASKNQWHRVFVYNLQNYFKAKGFNTSGRLAWRCPE